MRGPLHINIYLYITEPIVLKKHFSFWIIGDWWNVEISIVHISNVKYEHEREEQSNWLHWKCHHSCEISENSIFRLHPFIIPIHFRDNLSDWVKEIQMQTVICFYFVLSTLRINEKGLRSIYRISTCRCCGIRTYAVMKENNPAKRLNFHTKQIYHAIFTDSSGINPLFNPRGQYDSQQNCAFVCGFFSRGFLSYRFGVDTLP